MLINRPSTKTKRPKLLNKRKDHKMRTNNFRHKLFNVRKRYLNITGNTNENIVVNLSNRPLSLIETATLNKGLNFCITNVKPEFYHNRFSKEVDSFTRTLQIRHMFRDKNNDHAKPFTGNPSWNPPTSKRNKTLDGYSQFLKTEINNIVETNKIKHNISISERKALASLRKDKNILIQKADKGGSIVVLNTSQYRDKMNAMLADPVTYTTVPYVDLTKLVFKPLLEDLEQNQTTGGTRHGPPVPLMSLTTFHAPYWAPSFHANT